MVASLNADEKRQALAAVLSSRTFARAAQLKDFLRFVCEAELTGRAAELTEYLIAIEVFHRPTDYSGAEDSIVRTRAYELRQKLDKLYKLELRDAAIQIELPKGSYIPAWRKLSVPAAVPLPVLPAETPVAPAPAVPVSAAAAPRFPWWWLTAAAVAGAAVALLVSIGLSPARVDPILAEAWGPMLQPGANVLFCVATPLHLIVGPDSHAVPGSPIYPAPPELYSAFRQHRILGADQRLGMTITDTSLAAGTMNAVVSSARLFTAARQPFEILPERLAPLPSLENRHAVLFGTPVDSEALTRLLEPAPLTIDYDPGSREFVVVNRNPSNGLPRMLVPRKDESGAFTQVYGIVTVLRGDNGSGSAMKILFTGITSVGTHAAASYFTSPAHLRALKTLLHGRFPSSYQVIVKSIVNRLSLLEYEYVGNAILAP